MAIKSQIKLLIAVFCLTSAIELNAQGDAGRIEQSERIIEKDRRLTERITSKKSFYIDTILVSGANALPEGEIERIIRPFRKKRLSGSDIDRIIGLFRLSYGKSGWRPDSVGFAYSVAKNSLEIIVDENAIIHNPEGK